LKTDKLAPVFTDRFPNPMEEGRLYVSMTLAIAGHLCCCGCKTEVVTPLSPTDWTLIFDGDTVSLDPSIGNWSFHCQSHYLIVRGAVHWAPKWSKERIRLGRYRDRFAKERYFSRPLKDRDQDSDQPQLRGGWRSRLARVLSGNKGGSTEKRHGS
jgi:hypothetical protein